MKRLELNIQCCKDCPYLKWRYGLNRYTCLQSDAIIFVRGFPIHINIHPDCLLPHLMTIDTVEKDWVNPRLEKCPKCGSVKICNQQFRIDTVMPEGILLFFCDDCGERF